MTLPIIIMLERHWDEEAKITLTKALPSLRAQGYNIMSVESASDESEEGIIASINRTIDFIQSNKEQAQKQLQRNRIHVQNLSAMNYTELQQLFLTYVSSTYSNEMALWFKEKPGHQQKLKMIEQSKSLKMIVKGVDLPKKKLALLQYNETNLSNKVAAIHLLDDERINSFKEHLLALQKQGKGLFLL